MEFVGVLITAAELLIERSLQNMDTGLIRSHL